MHVTQDEDQAQTERTERARSAILAGKFQVTRINPGQWTVKNGDKLPYVVALKPNQEYSNGSGWTCTCIDFQQRGPQVLCKHIEGVRLLEEAQNQTPPLSEKENHMDDIPPSNEVDQGQIPQEDPVLWELRQPLDMARVKRRQAPGMGSVPYLEGYEVIDRANGIFRFGWSFDLIGEPVIVRWQKKILIWNQQEKRKVPSLDADGNVQLEEVGLVYVTGKVTVELEEKLFSHADLGRCIFTGDTPEALDMALAGSATDCLKRCFRQLGDQFGLSLYDKEIAQNAGLEQNHSNGEKKSINPSSHSSSSPQTLASVVSRKYGDGISVNGNASEQEAFDQFKARTGKAPASKEELRNWLAAQKNVTEPATVAG
jgi:hypothetical protein